MHCDQCGQPIDRGDRYCSACGVPTPKDVTPTIWPIIAAGLLLITLASGISYTSSRPRSGQVEEAGVSPGFTLTEKDRQAALQILDRASPPLSRRAVEETSISRLVAVGAPEGLSVFVRGRIVAIEYTPPTSLVRLQDGAESMLVVYPGDAAALMSQRVRTIGEFVGGGIFADRIVLDTPTAALANHWGRLIGTIAGLWAIALCLLAFAVRSWLLSR